MTTCSSDFKRTFDLELAFDVRKVDCHTFHVKLWLHKIRTSFFNEFPAAQMIYKLGDGAYGIHVDSFHHSAFGNVVKRNEDFLESGLFSFDNHRKNAIDLAYISVQ